MGCLTLVLVEPQTRGQEDQADHADRTQDPEQSMWQVVDWAGTLDPPLTHSTSGSDDPDLTLVSQ